MGQRATTDELFNDAYSDQGMQPSVGNRQVRNVEVATKRNIINAAGRETGRTSNRFSKRFTKEERRAANNIAPVQDTRNNPSQIRGVQVVPNYATQKAANDEYAPTKKVNRSLNYRRRQAQLKQSNNAISGKGLTKNLVKGAGRTRAIKVTMRILGPLTTFYFFVQLPLTLLGAVLFGMKSAIDTIFSKAEITADAGFFTNLVNAVKNATITAVELGQKAIDALSQFFAGFDISTLFDPMTYFSLTYVIFVVIAFLQLLIVGLLYKLAMLEPLGGKGAGLKYGALMLALVGYSIPVVNIFPWVGLWIFAIWLNPK